MTDNSSCLVYFFAVAKTRNKGAIPNMALTHTDLTRSFSWGTADRQTVL